MIVVSIVINILQILIFLIFIRAILSWVPNLDHHHPIVHLLDTLTEPFVQPVRRLLPPVGIDFSPLITFLILQGLIELIKMVARNL